MVDAADSKSAVERRAGSSPAWGTIRRSGRRRRREAAPPEREASLTSRNSVCRRAAVQGGTYRTQLSGVCARLVRRGLRRRRSAEPAQERANQGGDLVELLVQGEVAGVE